MSGSAIEKLIANAIHSAFVKYPEGDGGTNLDYEWIPPDQSAHITKAILADLEAGGYQILKKGRWLVRPAQREKLMRNFVARLKRRLFPLLQAIRGYEHPELVELVFKKLAYEPTEEWPEIPAHPGLWR
jgi:hypothetical protein